jgi:hypothetical protein
MGALLLLEYGLAASVVAVGWSGYMVSLLGDFGIHIPANLTGPAGHHLQENGVDVLVNGAPVVYLFNLPAFLVCLALAMLLIVGVSESAKFNNMIVAIKVTVLVAFILVGGFIILKNLPTYTPNWQPFIPEPTGAKGEFGWSGIIRAASIVFFAYIGFEAVSTAGRKPRIRKRICRSASSVAGCLHHHLHPGFDRADDDRQLPLAQRARSGRGRGRRVRAAMGVVRQDHQGRCDHRPHLRHPRPDVRPDPYLLHDGPRRTVARDLRAGAPEVPYALDQHDDRRPGCRDRRRLLRHQLPRDATSVGTLAAFAIVSLTVIWLRRTHPDIPRGYRVPLYPVLPALGILSLLRSDLHGRDAGADLLRLVHRRRDRPLFRLRHAQFRARQGPPSHGRR